MSDDKRAPSPDDLDPAEDGRPERAEVAHEGWKEMAAALGCSEKTAYRLSIRDYDPLPVRFDFLGRAYIYAAALKSWLNRQDLPSHAYHELQRIGRLPGQIRRAHRTKTGRTARSPVQRARMSKAAKRGGR